MPTAYTRVSCGSVSKWQSRSNRINECCSAKNVEITIPDEFAGSIMGDLNARRGRIQGMDNKAGNTLVKAEVPMSEMLTYGVDLTAMTQGRGSFSMEMHHYDVVPGQLQEKIIEKAKAERGEVKEEVE
jgi:elongation factor G